MADALTLKQQIEGSKYVYVGFNPADEIIQDSTPKDPLVISNSQDAINWTKLQQYDNNIYLRDPDIVKINGYYWIIGTLKLLRTLDFVNFDTYPLEDTLNTASNGKYKYIWAPEFCQDKSDDSWHIVYSANDGNRHIYFADFDPNDGTVTNCFQQTDVDCGSSIDPDINYLNGTYYLWLSSARLFTSSTLMGHYTEIPTNIIEDSSAKWYEAPEMLIAGDYAYLYQDKIDSHVTGVSDSGYMVYRVARITNLTKWSDEKYVQSDINMRHGSFLYNATVTAKVPDWSFAVDSFDPIVRVKDISHDEMQALSCIEWNTFYIQWAQNSTFQLQGTFYDDGSLGFQLLNPEATITFNGQQYIVKQATPDYNNGQNTKQVVASHIYSDISRTRQYNTKSGTITYHSPKDVLSWYLDNNPYNVLGFTYSVYGDWPAQQITDLGNNSGKDALSTICSTWTNAIIYPNNKEIGIYTPSAFQKDFGKRIDYLNNAEEVKMTIDSTALANKVKCYGKTQDTSSDSTTTTYYFNPFFVQDESSIAKYGVHLMDDVNDDRFTDATSMKNYALGQLINEPVVSIEITGKDNEIPVPGEQRHLMVEAANLDTTVSIVGFTWYPFAPQTPTVYEFDNLAASILNNQSLINLKLRDVEQMAQQAINKANSNSASYYSSVDPQSYSTVKTGDIWVKPLTSTTNTTEGSES